MQEMHPSWNYSLIALSVLTAVIGSYIALYFAGSLRDKQGLQRILWTMLGATIMGMAIWSMHFVGMLAMSMPMPMTYDPFLSLLSILAAAIGSGLAFLMFQRPAIQKVQYVFASIAMGLAIATMHYTGMASMKMPMQIVYTPGLFALSIIIAIVASAGALWLASRPTAKSISTFLAQKLGSAIVMGIAISGMHYTGMAAAHYYHTGNSWQTKQQLPTVGILPLTDLLIGASIVFAIALIVLSTHAMAERQRIIDALRKSEELYQLAITGSNDGMWDWDHTHNTLVWNTRCYEQLGLPENPPITTALFYELVHPDDLEAVKQIQQAHLANQVPYEIEFRMRHSSGEYRYYFARAKTLRDEQGTPLRTTGVRTDITKLKNAEQALAASERRFLLTFEQAPVGIGHIDSSGKFTRMNQKYCEILGYTGNEWLNLHFQEITHPEDLETENALYDQLKNKEIDSYSREKRSIRKDGSFVWVNRSVSIVWDKQGEFEYAIVIAEDITAKKVAERALVESQRKLAESNRDLEQFAAVASHDLQAPLRKVRIFCDMIYDNAKDNLDSATLDLLERSKLALASAQNLVQDLLALAVVNKDERPFREVDLSKVIYRVLMNLDPEIKQKRAKITLGHIETVWGDEVQLEQLIQNLVSNALKYQPPGQIPQIQIESGCFDHTFCQFSVQDNGIGIPVEYKERIFEPFKRLHGKGGPYEGTGIGLSICKRIVERHGGLITVESEPGAGCKFMVQLPHRAKAYQSMQESKV